MKKISVLTESLTETIENVIETLKILDSALLEIGLSTKRVEVPIFSIKKCHMLHPYKERK